MTDNDEKALTYTTTPLVNDTYVTGHPVISIWVESTATDGDMFVYLEEIDADGHSHYVTEGTLRASHREIATPDHYYLDLPYHRSFAEDIQDLPAHPVQLKLDLHPTSNLFDAGHRIRVTITGADADTYKTPQLEPPPTIAVHRSKNKSSYIKLPIAP